MSAEQPAPGASVSNSSFLRELAQGASNGTSLWVTAFTGSPDLTDAVNWFGGAYNAATMPARVDAWRETNTYCSVAALAETASGLHRRKANFSRLLVLVADDCIVEDLQGQVSYILETSPGKHQVGIFIDAQDKDAADQRMIESLLSAMSARGMVRADPSGNNPVRYVRLPVGQNQKPRESGPFNHVLRAWKPGVRLTLADAAATFGIDLESVREARSSAAPSSSGTQDERLRILTANILRGDQLHDSIAQVAASLASTGMPAGAIVNMLRALMESSLAPKDERWQARYQDIPRAVTSADRFRREIVPRGEPIPEGEPLGPEPPPATDDEVSDVSPDRGEAEPKPERSSSFHLYTLRELMEQSKSMTWLVRGVFPSDSVGVLFGASGSYKSFVVIDLAMHVAHGLQWLGKPTKRGKVLFIAAEGALGLARRIEAWHRAHGMNMDEAGILILRQSVDLVDSAGEVCTAVREIGFEPDLVIVDTLAKTYSGEENSATDMGVYLREIDLHFRMVWLCCVILIHHVGHAEESRPRGSSALRAGTEFMFGVFREGDGIERRVRLDCKAMKEGDDECEFWFSLDKEELDSEPDGQKVTSLVARYITDPKELSEAISEKEENGGSKRGGADVVFMDLLRSANGRKHGDLYRRFMETFGQDKKEDARKRAYFRAKNAATSRGYMEVSEDGFVVLLPAFTSASDTYR